MRREFFDIQFGLMSLWPFRLVIFPVLPLCILLAPWKLAAQDSQPAIGGVVNGATYDPSQPLAPGTIISIFGSNLSDGSMQSANQTPLPTVLA